MKAIIISCILCTFYLCTDAKSVADFMKCLTVAKDKCMDTCEQKVNAKYSKAARQCMDDFQGKMESKMRTCMTEAGVKDTIDCFVPPGGMHMQSDQKEPPFMARFDAEFPELVEGKKCFKTCMSTSTPPCIEGCGAKIDADVVSALRKCKPQPRDFFANFTAFKTCLHTAVGTTAPSDSD